MVYLLYSLIRKAVLAVTGLQFTNGYILKLAKHVTWQRYNFFFLEVSMEN